MNRLSTSKRADVIRCLVESNSIRSTVRITGASKNTVAKLLLDLEAACAAYWAFRTLPRLRMCAAVGPAEFQPDPLPMAAER